LPTSPLMRISPRGFRHRPDVVEDDARDCAGPQGRKQHGQDAAPGRADEHRAVDLERREHRNEIRSLDGQQIVSRLAIVVGATAAAVIERYHSPGFGRILRQRPCELVKIRR
jgi:hypothetical protein